MSSVSRIQATSPAVAAAHFASHLSVETDCADVAGAMRNDDMDFALLHVVGSTPDYERRHIPGALNLPHTDISAERIADWPAETLFVVCCVGRHCNGAALRLAELGRFLKVMIGGLGG